MRLFWLFCSWPFSVSDDFATYRIQLAYLPGKTWFESFKTELKARGAQWNASAKVWEISRAHHAAVVELLKTVPRPVSKAAVDTRPTGAAPRPEPAPVEPSPTLRLHFHYGTIHERPRGQALRFSNQNHRRSPLSIHDSGMDTVFRHKGERIYRVLFEKTGVDYDGEAEVTLTCALASEAEHQKFIAQESRNAEAAADLAVLDRVLRQGREEAPPPDEAVIEWVRRDDLNPYGDDSLGLCNPAPDVWVVTLRQRFSDGRTIERHYAVETADVDAIRRATEQATADRMTAIIADGPVE